MSRWVIVTVLLGSMLMAQTQTKSKPAGPRSAGKTVPAGQRFAQLSEQFMHESLALSPVNASQAGYHKHDGRDLDAELDDLSLGGAQKQATFYRQWHETLRRVTPVASLGPKGAADMQLIDEKSSPNRLNFEKIKNYRHNPTLYVELIGNALFLPLTQNYAAHDVRVGHVVSRIEQIPRALQ